MYRHSHSMLTVLSVPTTAPFGVQCCFTSSKTVRTITIRDGEPPTFTQLLGSE